MAEEAISAEEFTKRLGRLCLSGESVELPRKQRDRHIVLKSIALCLGKDRTYTERELNAALRDWTAEVGTSLAVDHAALRRALVDERYVTRSAGGEHYQLSPSAPPLFAPEVEALRPAEIVEHASAEAAAKREQYRKRSEA